MIAFTSQATAAAPRGLAGIVRIPGLTVPAAPAPAAPAAFAPVVSVAPVSAPRVPSPVQGATMPLSLATTQVTAAVPTVYDPAPPAAVPVVVPSSPASIPAPTVGSAATGANTSTTLTPAADPTTSGGALGLGVVSSLADLLGKTFGGSTAAQSANSGNLQPLAVQSSYPATATADASASTAGGLRWGRLVGVVLVAVVAILAIKHFRHAHGLRPHGGAAHV